MANSQLAERLARARRTQARSLAGEATPIPNEAANGPIEAAVAAQNGGPQSLENLLLEAEHLLPVIARHYAYEPEDEQLVRAAIMAPTPAGRRELALCVRQWRLDVVTYGIEGLPAGTAARAWVQFRRDVMGKLADEAGVPYTLDALACLPLNSAAPRAAI